MFHHFFPHDVFNFWSRKASKQRALTVMYQYHLVYILIFPHFNGKCLNLTSKLKHLLNHPPNFSHQKKSNPISSNQTTPNNQPPIPTRTWRNVPTACQGVNWPSWFWPFNRLFLAPALRAWRRCNGWRMGMEVIPGVLEGETNSK